MQPTQTIVHQSTNVNDITYSSFQNKHKGEKIIVCGCGTSATLAPVGQNIIIGVNDIGRLFTPNYLVVLNDKHSFNQDRWSWIQTSAAEYCFTQFANLDTKSKKIQLEVFAVTFEETGSELIALLKESEEIKINKPIYNRAQRKSIFQWA